MTSSPGPTPTASSPRCNPAVADVLRSGWITSGPKVAAFEAALSEYFGGRV
ncbi:MAG: DegT/DnrJ/EryC1/StrS family aminotransferase, partial [Ralstonia sp.]